MPFQRSRLLPGIFLEGYNALADSIHGQSYPAFYRQFLKKMIPQTIHRPGVQFHFQGNFLISEIAGGQLQKNKFLR